MISERRLQLDAEHQHGERDQRDRRDRPEELHRGVGGAAQERHEPDDRAEHGEHGRDQQADRPGGHGAADVAARTRGRGSPGRAERGSRSRSGSSGVDDAERGQQLPGDEEAEDAGDAERDLAQRAPCGAPGGSASHRARGRDGGARSGGRGRRRCPWALPRRGGGCRGSRHPAPLRVLTAAGSAGRSRARRRGTPNSTARAARSSRSDVGDGREGRAA